MSSIQAYKAHKQEGTLVSKVHKQLRGTRSAHLPKHPYISGCKAACLTTKQFFQFFVTLNRFAYPTIMMQPLM